MLLYSKRRVFAHFDFCRLAAVVQEGAALKIWFCIFANGSTKNRLSQTFHCGALTLFLVSAWPAMMATLSRIRTAEVNTCKKKPCSSNPNGKF